MNSLWFGWVGSHDSCGFRQVKAVDNIGSGAPVILVADCCRCALLSHCRWAFLVRADVCCDQVKSLVMCTPKNLVFWVISKTVPYGG